MIDRVARSQELHDNFYKKIYVKSDVEYVAVLSHTFVAIELIPNWQPYIECYNYSLTKPAPKYYIDGDAETIKSKLLDMGFVLKA